MPSAAPTPTQEAALPSSTIPACAGAIIDPSASLPTEIPASFPLPPNLAISNADVEGERITVDGVVPTSLQDAAAFMTGELPAAGFEITESDAEQDEAEASFAGNGVSGRFRLHGIAGCPDAITFAVTLTTGQP